MCTEGEGRRLKKVIKFVRKKCTSEKILAPRMEFAAALFGPEHFLSPDQESEIHCLIICGIQLLTPNNLGF